MDDLLEKIVHNQATIMGLVNEQQEDLRRLVHKHRKKEEDAFAEKMEMILDEIKRVKLAITRTRNSLPPTKTSCLEKDMADSVVTEGSQPKGLYRETNTCYMKSVLQALAAVDPGKIIEEASVPPGSMLEIIEDSTNSEVCRGQIDAKRDWEINLMREFIGVLELLRSDGLPVTVSPHVFQFTFTKLSQKNEYDGLEEQDTAMFFGDLLDCLHERELNHRQIINRLFRIRYYSEVRCSKSAEVKRLNDVGWYLAVQPLPGFDTTTIIDAGAEKPELTVCRLLEYHMTYHDVCVFKHEGQCVHQRCFRFVQLLPDFLMLKFLRHKVAEGKNEWKAQDKLAYRVLFDEDDYTIDLSTHVEPYGDEKPRYIYKLRSVIYHSGSFETGHYFTVSRKGYDSDLWWQCNDGEVSRSPDGPYPIGEYKESQAYMALYERVGQCGPTTGAQGCKDILDDVEDYEIEKGKMYEEEHGDNNHDNGSLEPGEAEGNGMIVIGDCSDTNPPARDGNEQDELRQPPNLIALTTPSYRHYKPRGIFDNQFNCCISVILQSLAAIDPYQLEQELGNAVGPEFRLTPALRSEPMTDSSAQYKRIFMGSKPTQFNLVWEFLNLLRQLRTHGNDAVNPYALQYTLSETIGPKPQRRKYDGERSHDAAQFYLDLIRHLTPNAAQSGHGDTIKRHFWYELCSTDTERDPQRKGYILTLHPLPGITATVGSPQARSPESILVTELLRTFATEQTTPFSKTPDFLMLKFSRHRATEGVSSTAESKLAYRVDFERDRYALDLSEYVDPEMEEPQRCRYTLRTVIYHLGDSYERGAYVAVLRAGSRFNWYLCNSDTIQEVDVEYFLEEPDG